MSSSDDSDWQRVINLLVVDDTEDNRALLRRRLEPAGFYVREAASGEAALAMVQRSSFDLILLDIYMPGLNGFDVLGRLRSTHSARELPVLMLSSSDDSECVTMAKRLGANGYLTKPVDLHVAMATIRREVGARRSQVTPEPVWPIAPAA